MKKSRKVFRKLLAITLSLSLMVATLVISAPHVHAASVDYYYEGGTPIGIKSITRDGVKYFDIFGEGDVKIDSLNEVEFFKKALNAKNDEGHSALELWSNVAAKIFADNGRYAHGINGNLLAESHNFSGRTAQVNLPLLLRAEQAEVLESGYCTATGLRYATSLAAAQTLMAEELINLGYVWELSFPTVEEILENCANDNGSLYSPDDKSGYKLLNDETGQTVLTSIVTLQEPPGSNLYSLPSSLGIAFYDFELVPIAGNDIKFVTAADGYENLEAAANAGVDGVTYSETGTGKANTMYTTNPAMSEATVEIGYEESTSTSVSNFMESTKTYSFSETFESSTKFGLGFPFLTNGEQSLTFGFTTEQAISTAYGSEDSYTESSTVSSSASVTLPAHTQIGINQQTGTTEMTLDYDCPTYLTYKVAIFSMFTTMGMGYPWEYGGMCTVFGTDNSIGGYSAVDNLEKRVANKEFNGFERAQGNFFARRVGEDVEYMKYEANWNSILGDMNAPIIANGSATMRDCVEELPGYIPLSSAGATISMTTSSINNNVSGIVPLYDLDYVQTDGSSVYTIAPGGTLDFSKIATAGYNSYSVPYYGYVPDGGDWVLCDENGNELDNAAGVTLADVGNYQKLTAESVGTYYAKFKIDENNYNKVDSSGKITNADLSSTAIVTINVTETGLDHICTEGPWETTIKATCTAEGEQVAKCMVCGRVMYTQTVDKLDHIPVTITTPATCTSEGSIKNICGVCLGFISSETIEKLEHNEGVWKIDFEATAEHHGQMSRYCTMCDTALESKEFELHTHTFGYESITREPTCIANGEKGLFCSICNGMYATDQIEKTEHVPGGWKILKDSSCTQEGLMQQTCAICDALLEESKVIPMHDHNEGAWKTVLEATCNISGEKVKECTICGGTLETEEIPSHGHEAVWLTVKEADCKTTGREENTCTICNAILETRAIEKTEHIPGNWETVTDATCELDGEKQQDCSICGCLLSTKAIPAHGHAAVWITVKEADCKTTGREENVCTICDAVLETREIARTEHIPGKWEITQQPTCTQSGLMQQTCAICGALIGEPVVIDAHDHDNGAWRTVLEATCTTDGERIKECTICKGTIESEVIPALGHDDGVWTTALEASCETQGERHKNCTRCGQLIESERIDALGHTPGPEMTCATDQVCLVCEEVLVPADGKSHTWTEWETYKEAKFFTEEQQRRVCTSCDLEEYRFVKGTSKCHKYFPHCDGSGEDCWACNTLSNTNGFFRNLGRFIVWFFTENIISIILFPFAHGHFHEHINLDEIFGSK